MAPKNGGTETEKSKQTEKSSKDGEIEKAEKEGIPEEGELSDEDQELK